MSDGELSRLEVLRDMDQRRLTTEAAAQLLGLERRQVFRLLKAYRTEGATGLISKRRGRRSNRRKPEALRDEALAIIRERYWDFGPTLAAEKLREGHGIALGRETLRLWMIEAGIWARPQAAPKAHPSAALSARVRRRTGADRRLRALVVRGSRAAMHPAGVCRRRDQPADASAVCRERVRPLPISTPPAPIWRPGASRSRSTATSTASSGSTIRGALGGDGMTQFGRALHALNIDIICANSSQAKGRVERAHKTLQDRLVKELRLAGAATLAAGNALLPAFMADYNARFAKPPANKKDLHRPLRAGDDLEDAFAWKEERTLSQALTLQYDKVIFILEPSEQAKAAIGKRVTVVDYPDGRLAIRYKGVELAYRTFDKIRQVDQGAIIDNKRLGPVLAMIRDEQLRRGARASQRTAPA